MSWSRKYHYWVILITFVSGFAAASMFWFLSRQSGGELHPQHGAISMPEMLGGTMLTQPKALSTSGAPGTASLRTPGKPASSETTGKLSPDLVEDSPMLQSALQPGVVKNPPIPGAVQNLPIPGVVDNPPIPGVVENPLMPGMIKEQPVSKAPGKASIENTRAVPEKL